MGEVISAYYSELSIDALRQNAFLQGDIETLARLAEEAREFAWNSNRGADEEGERHYTAVAEGCLEDIKRLSGGLENGTE